MGFRFRKSLRIAPGIRINLSKSGISTSLGGAGASINLSSRGTRHTVGLPGTGLSFSSMSSGPGSSPPAAVGSPTSNQGCGCLIVVGLLLVAISMCSKAPPTDSAQQTPTDISSLSSPFSNGTGSSAYTEGQTVYVTAQTLNARSGPSKSSRIVSSLPKRSAVRVVDKRGDWLKVAQGAALFWIASSHVSSIQPVQPLMSEVPTKRPKVQRRPSRAQSGYDNQGCPCSGSRVCIGPRGGRYCITSGGNKRYGV